VVEVSGLKYQFTPIRLVLLEKAPPMHKETIVILGIPIDNLDMDETVERIFAMIGDYAADRRPRLVATANVDFIVNTLSWRLKRIRHPELFDILSRADLVTTDGMPLVWIGKLLGSPLKQRVTGADLVPKLAEAAALRQKSIYFLGGRGDAGKRAASVLQQRFPNLRVAGTDAPFVHVKGETIADAEETDMAIVERINRSGADILLIGFGNPKQEIWFDRNRNRLSVPVSIGIGGTYEFIIGSVARAPRWMQQTGFEWAFRIAQDPGRLWKRYFVGFFKFGLMIWPAILHQQYKRLQFKFFHRKPLTYGTREAQAPPPDAAAISVIPLPNALDASVIEAIRDNIDKNIQKTPNLVLDFRNVTFIDSSGLGLLIRTLRKAGRKNKNLLLAGISLSARRFFKLSRTLDLFKAHIFDDLHEAFDHIKEKTPLHVFYYSSVIRSENVIFDLYGTLDADQMASIDIETVFQTVRSRDCILDLSDLDFVDSSGIVFFLKIHRHVSNHSRVCVLCGLKDNVFQMFHITKLSSFFVIVSDRVSAEEKLREIERARQFDS